MSPSPIQKNNKRQKITIEVLKEAKPSNEDVYGVNTTLTTMFTEAGKETTKEKKSIAPTKKREVKSKEKENMTL